MKLSCQIIKNNLHCSINIKNSAIYQYAFYLKQDGERIAVKWYTDNDSAVFNLSASGDYTVIAFAKAGEQAPIITESEPIYYLDMQDRINVSIFGSCVSRDILETPNFQFMNLKSYIARQSIVSAVSKPVECNMDDINLSSKFQKRMIYNYFTKIAFDLFANDKSEALIIDLIDERFKLVKYKDSIVTYSSELMVSNSINKPKFINENKLFGSSSFIFFIKTQLGTVIKKYIDEFVLKILQIYPQEKIIIHRAMMLDYYRNKDGNIVKFPLNHIINNKKINAKLHFMYDYLIYKIPNCKVIDICDQFIADENNKWGLSPMHYEPNYYVEVGKRIFDMASKN